MKKNLETLKGKRILFLCPKFFSYEMKIKEQMEEMGAEVVFFDERPSNTTLSKAFIRMNQNLMKRKIETYYQKIIAQISNQTFDYILICQGEATPVFFLEFLEKEYPNVLKVLYLWDSVKNKPLTLGKIKYFDKVSSFDFEDCRQYDWQFRPLFFSEMYERMENKENSTIDLFFVGTIHSDRYEVLKKIADIFYEAKRKVYYYLYLPSPLMFYYYKYFKGWLKNSKKKEFSFTPLESQILEEKLSHAKTVIDIQHPKQSGLTMRTIEMMGAKKKIITTNPSVSHYDFYSKKNICIINRENPIIPSEFLLGDYEEIPEKIFNRYRLSYFILELLNFEKEDFPYYVD